MKPDKLIAMANQIAHFFQSYPEDRAIAGVRDHIVRFWTPQMRKTLREKIEENPTEVHATVLVAVQINPPQALTDPKLLRSLVSAT